MKKFNLQKEIIIVNRNALLHAINTARRFGITIEGTIVFGPFSDEHIYIYQGLITPNATSALGMPKPQSIETLLGNGYRIVEDDDRILIRANLAWQEVLAMNLPHSDYDDSSADGIGNFSDNTLETIGWHATEFDITYREMAEYLETTCEGTLLCIEIEEPYQFSGLGFISDQTCAHDKLFEYCRERALTQMHNDPDFAIESLDSDEREAATFFNLIERDRIML